MLYFLNNNYANFCPICSNEVSTFSQEYTLSECSSEILQLKIAKVEKIKKKKKNNYIFQVYPIKPHNI